MPRPCAGAMRTQTSNHALQRRAPRVAELGVVVTRRSPLTMTKASLTDKFPAIQDHWRPKVVAELNGQELKLAKFSGVFRGIVNRAASKEQIPISDSRQQ